MSLIFFFFFNQKTAYEMRISDWSSDVCSSDLLERELYEWRIRLLPSPLWRGWRLPQHARRSRRSFHRPRRPRRSRLRLLRKHQSPAPRFRVPWPTSWKKLAPTAYSSPSTTISWTAPVPPPWTERQGTRLKP